MPGWHGTLAQRASIALGFFFLFTGIVGLALNPDFGTGAGLSSEFFLVDWNGWHAVETIALAAAAFVAAARPVWALGFQAYNAVANGTVAVWVLFDNTPLGILDLPNVAADVALHTVVAAISAAVFVVQLRRDRAVAARPATG